MKSYNRAYNIKHNGKIIAVVGGEKAGRYAKGNTTPPKPQKRQRTSHKAKQKAFIGILWFLLFATGCTGIAEFNSMRQQPLTAEPMKAERVKAEEPQEEAQPEDLFKKYFGDKAETIKAICKAENRKEDPTAVYHNKNGSIDQGLCQINTINIDKYVGENIFDPEVNIRTAKKIYDDRQKWDTDGFNAWTMYKNGKYKKYLIN